MQKVIFYLLVSLLSLTAHSQRFIWSPDSLSVSDPNYGMDRYHDILKYHDPIMYLAFPIIKPIVDRPLTLEDGEGKKGYWLENHFGYRFAIYKGKYYSSPFLQRMRLTLDANLSGRLTRDDSNPLLPFNNKFGVGVDFLFSRLDGLKKEKTNLVWTTLQLHHYSNGMADSFFIDNSVQRNNYRSGDFSTNYGRLLLNFGRSSRDKSILITSIGFQQDLDLRVGESHEAIFHADTTHNIVHIVSGLLFIIFALAIPDYTKLFLQVFGVVYFLIGVLGLFQIGSEGSTKVLGFLHVNGPDNFLHIGLGIIIFLAGTVLRKSS